MAADLMPLVETTSQLAAVAAPPRCPAWSLGAGFKAE